jgi:hypothetical protein
MADEGADKLLDLYGLGNPAISFATAGITHEVIDCHKTPPRQDGNTTTGALTGT